LAIPMLGFLLNLTLKPETSFVQCLLISADAPVLPQALKLLLHLWIPKLVLGKCTH